MSKKCFLRLLPAYSGVPLQEVFKGGGFKIIEQGFYCNARTGENRRAPQDFRINTDCIFDGHESSFGQS